MFQRMVKFYLIDFIIFKRGIHFRISLANVFELDIVFKEEFFEVLRKWSLMSSKIELTTHHLP